MTSAAGPLGGVFVADTSVWTRSHRPTVAPVLAEAISAGQIATCAMIALELMYAARDTHELIATQRQLAILHEVPITRSVMSAAMGALRELAARGAAGYHRVKPPDAVIAAAAANRGLGVIHYDADYDRLAEVLGFESRWLAPAGTID